MDPDILLLVTRVFGFDLALCIANYFFLLLYFSSVYVWAALDIFSQALPLDELFFWISVLCFKIRLIRIPSRRAWMTIWKIIAPHHKRGRPNP